MAPRQTERQRGGESLVPAPSTACSSLAARGWRHKPRRPLQGPDGSERGFRPLLPYGFSLAQGGLRSWRNVGAEPQGPWNCSRSLSWDTKH